MTTDEMLALERLAKDATPGPWVLWTGCSWRRFGSEHTGQTVCEPTNHPIDKHPDLWFRNGADAAYIAAAHPSAVLALIERIRHLEQTLEAERQQVERAYQLMGMGGFAGEAPPELLLVAQGDMGCDAWLDPQRVCVADEGKTNLDRMPHIRWTEPVRYIRADTIPPPDEFEFSQPLGLGDDAWPHLNPHAETDKPSIINPP